MANGLSKSHRGQAHGPVRRMAAIAPDDNTDLTEIPQSIYVGVAGDIVVQMAGDTGGTSITMTVAQGYHPLCVDRVLATGTTASNIIALYMDDNG